VTYLMERQEDGRGSPPRNRLPGDSY
jgi:hypothetical protein